MLKPIFHGTNNKNRGIYYEEGHIEGPDIHTFQQPVNDKHRRFYIQNKLQGGNGAKIDNNNNNVHPGEKIFGIKPAVIYLCMLKAQAHYFALSGEFE